MTEPTELDASGQAAELLESAADVHEAEGRLELALRHRRAAEALRSDEAPSDVSPG